MNADHLVAAQEMDGRSPRLPALERVVEYGISQKRLRVFADLWDIEQFFDCDCSPAKGERLRQINREQRLTPPVSCESCQRDTVS